MVLLSRLYFKGHVVFCDRLYTSRRLIERAIEIDQHVCGTVRSDRGFPVQLQATTVSLEVGQWMDLSCGRIWGLGQCGVVHSWLFRDMVKTSHT